MYIIILYSYYGMFLSCYYISKITGLVLKQH
jgi:hypothetical protein